MKKEPLSTSNGAGAAAGKGNAVNNSPVSYRLSSRDGRIVIESSAGVTVPWACYSSPSERVMDAWQQKQRGFIDSGFHLYQIGIWRTWQSFWRNPFFSLDGDPVEAPREPVNIDEQAEWLIAQDTQALFLVRFSVHPDPGWRDANIGQFPVIGTEDNGMPRYSVNASLASDSYISAVDRLIRDTVAWCEKQPWRDRIAGYTVYPYGEGLTELAITGRLFEASAPMEEKFAEYIRKKYRTDRDLQEAWNDRDASLESITLPTDAEWEEKRIREKLMHWPDPAAVGRERDYFLLQKDLFHRYCTTMFDAMLEATASRRVIKGFDILKQGLQGWMHDAGFFGAWHPGSFDSHGSIHLASGSIGAGPLLDHPGVDMLVTPGVYDNRAMGYSWESEGLSDSLLLRGKVNFTEADIRTWVGGNWVEPGQGDAVTDAGTILSIPEMDAGFDRLLADAVSRNRMYYFMSVCGAHWWFNDPSIQKKAAEQKAVIEQSLAWPWRDTEHAVCLVVDDNSAMYEDFSSGYQNIAVYNQIIQGLALCGVPYRIHLLSDLARENFPPYRCFIFPDLFKVGQEELAVLRNKVFRNGNVAIFGPGTGITDGQTLTAQGASEVLGIPMELVDRQCRRRTILQDHGHFISRNLDTATFGDSHAFGPLLVPASRRFGDSLPGAVQLGSTYFYYTIDRPGLFVVDHGKGGRGNDVSAEYGAGDYAVVFSAAVPLPPELIRECARYAGCNIWSEKNMAVYASGESVAFHTVKSGKHTVTLPYSCDVLDMAGGAVLYTNATSFTVDVKAPATRSFRLVPRGL